MAEALPAVGVVIPAGGQGLRARSSSTGVDTVPKQFLPLGSAGKPMFRFSLETFHRLDCVKEIVLVLPGGKLPGYAPLAADFPKLKLAAGGAERWESVKQGIAALSLSIEYIAVHDAARPFVSEAVIRRCLEAVDADTCVIPAVPATDTVKEVELERVKRTLDRRHLVLVQTPQVFSRALIEALYAALRERPSSGAGAAPTDEAMLAEQAGSPVRWVLGSDVNRKVTSAGDLAWAEWMAGRLEKGEALPEA